MSGDDKHESSLALALSGGGFRATLFHLGSLTRLNELGILKKLQCVSSVSGGSIIGNLLGLRWNELGLDSSGRAMNFHDLIFHPIKKFCSLDIDLIPSLVNMASMLTGGVSQGLDSNFKKLYGESTLADLPDETNAPKFVTIGSNLQTTSRIYFSRSLLWDERLGLIHKPEFSISKIVSISTAFPPFLSPVVLITDPNSWRKHESSDLFDKSALRKRMVLTDGGIHDPSAVTPLIDDFSNILVSDGSSTKEIWR
ncbi:MAG TPA: patatin-like phospholipase family protein, partial [Firmicutes bacterium]|nr:patatin-like phospholipase family protein [Bacillota bacterium]